jgi:serine protease Do
MQKVTQRKPIGWALALLLVAVGFALGLTFASGGSGGGPFHAPQSMSVTTASAAATEQELGYLDYPHVAAMVMPAVVNISTDKVVEQQQWQHPFFNDPFFRRFFGEPNQNDQNQQQIERALGSGVVISDDGYIMTNAHVVEKASVIQVSFADKEEYEAQLVGIDPSTDVALVKIDRSNMDYLHFGDSGNLQVGDRVMALGNPFGLGQTATAGIVSATGRNIGLIDYENLIQTDATINPGNSGGPLVNMKGELVGMNTAILSRSGGSQGIGFAIPSNTARVVIDQLREHGKVQRAWLGVMIQNVDQSMAHYYGLEKPHGVLISSVNKDTPAAAAGLKEGDIILSVDGEAVNSVSALRNRISLSPVGHEAKLQILRDGKERTVTVKLEALPEEQQTAQSHGGGEQEQAVEKGIDGVSVRDLTDRYRQMSDLPEDINGVLVASVDETSAAFREGLREGDVIVSVGNQEINDVDSYLQQVDKNKDRPILLRVYKPNTGTIFMAIPR